MISRLPLLKAAMFALLGCAVSGYGALIPAAFAQSAQPPALGENPPALGQEPAAQNDNTFVLEPAPPLPADQTQVKINEPELEPETPSAITTIEDLSVNAVEEMPAPTKEVAPQAEIVSEPVPAPETIAAPAPQPTPEPTPAPTPTPDEALSAAQEALQETTTQPVAAAPEPAPAPAPAPVPKQESAPPQTQQASPAPQTTAPAAPQTNLNGENKPGAPVFSDEQYGSLVFTYWEHVAIKDAKNSRGMVRPPSEEELTRDLKTREDDVKKVKPPPEERELRLGGIVYHNRKDWTIWLNEKRVTPDAIPKEVMDLKVSKNFIEIKWFDEWSNQIYPIRLRPHQRFNLDVRMFLPG